MPSMIFELTVEFEDGRMMTTTADQRDMAKWEAQPFGCGANVFETRSMMGFRFLAWSALDRRGELAKMKWADFDRQVIEVMPVDDEDSTVEEDAEEPFREAP